ncbi:MAG: radical SAM protein, partial [Bacteroidales bacterium]
KPYLQELRKIGINRLSIGIQSFNHSTLRFLGRTHNAEEALQGVYNASEVGFDNISIDLIYGITNRQKDVWKEDLKTVFKTPISHLSAYALTIEENTLLAKKIKNGNLDTLDENIAIEDFYTLLEATSRAGFEQYEVSNFAKSGKISRHNYAYWQGTPYIGLGPSAHSYHLNSRQWNICNLTQYIDGISTNNNFYEIEFLSENSKFNEFVLLRLRTRMGIDLNLAERLFGKEKREHIQGYFTNHVAGQDYIFINQCYHLTPQGQLLADQISEGLFIV